MKASTQERLEGEARFKDHAVETGALRHLARFYSVFDRSNEAYLAAVARALKPGGRLLEMGCGVGYHLVSFAQAGADIDAIDISPKAIEKAQEKVHAGGVEARVRFHRMNAEQTSFADHAFDVVCGSGIVHHLDVERAVAEVCRLLKPGGTACFLEPMGHNPAINLYRRLTPQLRTPGEHPLRRDEIDSIRAAFARSEVRYFCLASLLAVPLRNTRVFAPALKALELADDLLLSLDGVGRFAWVVLLTLQSPRG